MLDKLCNETTPPHLPSTAETRRQSAQQVAPIYGQRALREYSRVVGEDVYDMPFSHNRLKRHFNQSWSFNLNRTFTLNSYFTNLALRKEIQAVVQCLVKWRIDFLNKKTNSNGIIFYYKMYSFLFHTKGSVPSNKLTFRDLTIGN